MKQFKLLSVLLALTLPFSGALASSSSAVNLANIGNMGGYQATDWIVNTTGDVFGIGNISIESMGTVTNFNFRYRREGDSLHGHVYFKNGTASSGSDQAAILLPSGLRVNTTSKTLSSLRNKVGSCDILTSTGSSVAYECVPFIDASDATRVFFSKSRNSYEYAKNNGNGIVGVGTNGLFVDFTIPIAGWSAGGPGALAHASWTSFSMGITGTSSNPSRGTGVTEKAFWKCADAQDMLIRWEYVQTGAGSAGSGTYLWALPSGYTVDTSIAPASGSNVNLGNAGQGTLYSATPAWVRVYDSTHLALTILSSGSLTDIGSSLGSFSNATMQFSFSARVPISGGCN